MQRGVERLLAWNPPRGVGVAATVALVLGSGWYGVIKGGHMPAVAAQVDDFRNGTAIDAGFGIAEVSLSGQRSISREEILAIAGVTEKASLLFFDVGEARVRLKAQPWIADASLVKYFPDRLDLTIVEREALALWQKDGMISVIAGDGTVLEQHTPGRFDGLPLVVGAQAQVKARDFLALLARYDDLHDSVQASVLVGERRWNLRLKNGIDAKLPETNVEAALETLVRLDREKKLLTRDIAMIDLRMPDRVTVRLADDVHQARETAREEAKKEAAKAKVKRPAVAKPAAAPSPAKKEADT